VRSLMLQQGQITGTVLFAVLFLSVTSCASLPPPPKVFWENNQPTVGPTSPGPQGILVVYSEPYEGEDEELPTIYRRPVLLYNSAGQFLGTFNDHPIADDPVQIVLPPGRYLVVSKAQKSLRKVQVEIDDGLTTIVPESLIAQASPASS
jgi:hypothetical protein